MHKKAASPSRTYVAMCNKGNFSGFYFRKFTLPEKMEQQWWEGDKLVKSLGDVENSPEMASWYFLNRLNMIACVETVMTFEDYQSIKDQVHLFDMGDR